jgi:hypothetical protein
VALHGVLGWVVCVVLAAAGLGLADGSTAAVAGAAQADGWEVIAGGADGTVQLEAPMGVISAASARRASARASFATRTVSPSTRTATCLSPIR